jgi:hypothetical protein
VNIAEVDFCVLDAECETNLAGHFVDTAVLGTAPGAELFGCVKRYTVLMAPSQGREFARWL